MPDRINGLSFSEWASMAVEEMLVVDALSIYPNKTLDEENLHSLEILDGTTIKPLLDDRGARPVPPYPAYQQILWGFPRGEFTASADADGEFTADDLVYAPRTRRPFTPYGYSAVERALPMIDLYMKRLQWLRTEFTDGVTPDVFLLTDATYGDNPEILRAYERVMNDDLAGKSEQRRRARIMPDGMTPMFPPGMDAKYRSDFDEYIVKQIAGHFGVMPTQIGFAPKGGLGGSGVQQGESETSDIIGIQPILLWFTDLLNQLSYRFLNMPRDLVFSLASPASDDDTLDAQRIQTQIISGQLTLNEARSEMGLPLFTFPEADMPMVPNNIVPLADVQEVLAGIVTPADETAPAASAETEGETGTADMTEPDKSLNPVSIELAAFTKWTKGARKREFVFEFLDSFSGKSLNALAKHDPDAARELAKSLKTSATNVSVGSFVSWNSSGGRGRGKVRRVIRDGKVKVPGSSFSVTGTEEDPAVLITLYREGEDGWKPTDTVVGHRASTLTRIDSLKTVGEEKNARSGPSVVGRSEAGRAVNYFVSGEVPEFTWAR